MTDPAKLAAEFVTPDKTAIRDQAFAAMRDFGRDHFALFVLVIHDIASMGLKESGPGGNGEVEAIMALATIGAHEVLVSIAAEGDE